MLNNTTFLAATELLKDQFSEHKYLLAISGGVDSMVLLHLFRMNDFKFEVAHINYKLRGEESNLDEKLIANYCEKFGIKFHLYSVSDVDNVPKNSIQNWARKLRYQFFRKIQLEENIENLVTAHHLNDEIETFLINLSRGSGLKGLSGIPAKKNNIYRPFLQFPKEDLYNFAAENNIDFREDASNQKNNYLRNKIRLEIVPKLVETNSDFLLNFKNSLQYLHQSKVFLQSQISQIEEQILIDDSPDKIIYDKEYFEMQDQFVQFEILRKFGFDDPKEIAKIFLADTGKRFLSKKHELLINRNEIIINRKVENDDEYKEYLILENKPKDDKLILDLRKVISEHTNSSKFIHSIQSDQSETIWNFDLEKLVFPLKIRHRKAGDLFHPVEMFGRKKVSKLLNDEKLSLLDKKEIWLLADGNDDILGVIPYRQDRRNLAGDKTEKRVSFVF
jgi:tRNA(Ile)-lysidine synthase